jgi:hypothetical protein
LAERHVARLVRDIEQQLDTVGNAIHDEINDPEVTVRPQDDPQTARGLVVTLYISEKEPAIESASSTGQRTRSRSA